MNQYQQYLPTYGLYKEELAFLQKAATSLNDSQKSDFYTIYMIKRKKPQNLLLATLLSFIGIFGIQRFIVGQVGMGLLYFFTGGLCFVGVIVDLINYKALALEYNERLAYQYLPYGGWENYTLYNKNKSSFVKQRNIGLIVAIVGALIIFFALIIDFKEMVSTKAGISFGDLEGSVQYGNSALASEMKIGYLLIGIFILIIGSAFFVAGKKEKNNTSLNMEATKTNVEYNSYDTIAQIDKLNELRKKGGLTEKEFNDKKTELLKKV